MEYTRARNQARWATRKAQKEFEKKIDKELKLNPKQYWRYVNSKKKTKSQIPDLNKTKEKDSPRTSDDKEKAEVFNQYFKEVFTKEDLENLPDVENKPVDSMLCNIDITEEMVLKKLKELNQNKTPGPDQIHPRVLKELKDEVAQPLTIIFRKSIETGRIRIPKEWKDGHITPIHKKGNKHMAENYRPVCLTVICCKLMESILKDAMYSHLIRNNLINSNQHGFLSGRSTSTQLIET